MLETVCRVKGWLDKSGMEPFNAVIIIIIIKAVIKWLLYLAEQAYKNISMPHCSLLEQSFLSPLTQ